jgi:hypothetical protein
MPFGDNSIRSYVSLVWRKNSRNKRIEEAKKNCNKSTSTK